MKCPKCSFENPDTLKFCGECGTRLTSAEDTQPAFTKTIETPVTEFTRGTLFADRFEIIEELGKGGMGSVYRVEDRKAQEEIALKLIRPEISADENTIERFRNELTTARRIRHKNVCAMYDLGEDRGIHYITMEYVSGQDLKGLIRQTGKLAISTAISIAKQVCLGLSEAHALGIVHRDLKPGNIMIDKEGNIRIMDFGIARAIKAKGITGTGVMIGTPEYMSPEQAEAKEIDQRSDIYSLGIILYEMVTGQLPFEGETPLSIAMLHKSQSPKAPRELNPQLSDVLNQLILKCLHKEKEDRYASAVDLFKDLDQIEKGMPTIEVEKAKKKTLTSDEITVSFSLRRLLLPTLGLAALVIIAFLLWKFVLPSRRVPLPSEQRSIAIINFQNQTGETAFDNLQHVIPNLLITSLEQSPYLQVTTFERMRDLMRQLDKEEVDIINSDLGFELCIKDGVEAIVVGSFAKAGDIFVTDAKVLDVESKKILKSVSARGRGADSILASQIDVLSQEIAKGVGLSERKVTESQTTITDVTTSSLEAYNAYLKGVELVQKYYYADALPFLEKALALDPTFATAYLYLAKVCDHTRNLPLERESYENAKLYADRASEKERLFIEAAYARYIEGDPDKRFQVVQTLTEKYPKEKQAHFDLGRLYRNKDMLPEAIAAYQTASELDPAFGPALEGQGSVYAQLGDFDKAIEFYRKYADILPGDAAPLESLAELYFRMGRLDEAITKFKEVIEIKPNFGTEEKLAYVLALIGNWNEALLWLDKYIENAPSLGLKGRGYWFKGIYLFWMGRDKESQEALDQGVKLSKDFQQNVQLAIISMTRACINLYKGKNLARARTQLEPFVEVWIPYSPHLKHGNMVFYYSFLGFLDIKEGNIEAAKSQLKLIDAIKSKMPRYDPQWESHVNRFYSLFFAELLYAEGELDKAISKIKEMKPLLVPQMTPPHLVALNMPYLQDILPRLYMEKGDIDAAFAEYENLITFNPDGTDRRWVHPLYYYRLAKLYETKGWNGKAIENYEIFLDLWKDADPGKAEVEDAKTRVAALNGR